MDVWGIANQISRQVGRQYELDRWRVYRIIFDTQRRHGLPRRVPYFKAELILTEWRSKT